MLSTTINKKGRKKDVAKKGDGEGGFLCTVGDFVKDVGASIAGAFKFGKFDADVKGINLPHISIDEAEIVIDVLINNPNPIPIPLVDIEYLIESGERKLISGTIPDAGTIHAHRSKTVKIQVKLVSKDNVDTFADINPGQIVPYLLKSLLIIDVRVFRRFRIPKDKEGLIPIPEKPDVDLERVKWTHLDLDETKATLHLRIENFNPFKMGTNNFRCNVTLGETQIGMATLAEVAWELIYDSIGVESLCCQFQFVVHWDLKGPWDFEMQNKQQFGRDREQGGDPTGSF